MTIKAYISKYVLLKITSGDWPKGEKIPSENALALKFGCSRLTSREALISLVQMGYLISQKGRGYIVASNSLDNSLTSFEETHKIIKKIVEPITLTPSIKSVLGVKESYNTMVFRKDYYDVDGLVARQITVLNKDYIWKINYKSFEDSITKELAKQGIPINESLIEVKMDNKVFDKKTYDNLGYNNFYPLEIVNSWSSGIWVEKTARITSLNSFRIVYRKKKLI